MKVYPVTLMVKILTDYLRGGSFKPYCLVGKENWEPQNLRSPSKKCSRGHVSRNGAKSSILLSLAGEMSLSNSGKQPTQPASEGSGQSPTAPTEPR